MSSQRMARRRPIGPHSGLQIRRPIPEIQKGVKSNSCEYVTLYTGLRARVLPLRNIDENQLGASKKPGKVKSNERKVTLTPNVPICKAMSGDVLFIPWGVRPNIWCPPNAPDGLGLVVYIETPDGVDILTWDGAAYVGDTITLELVGDEWCFTGEINFCLSGDICCEENFPIGYAFVTTGGPLAKFEILRIDQHENNKGEVVFYTLYVEHIDQKGLFLVE